MARWAVGRQEVVPVRSVVVTGATGGIGSAVVEAFVRAGDQVALHYHTKRAEAEAAVAQLVRRFPDRHFAAVGADLRDPDATAHAMAEAARALGGIDVLVNNAGINRDRTLRKADPGEWRSVVDVNFLGLVHGIRAALPHMHAPGRIVNVSSIIGALGNFGQTNYASAKAAIFGLTKSLAQELGPAGITVNAVAPGFVDTPMTRDMPEEARRRWIERTPLGRFGRPEEIAACIVFLASPEASYVNGAILHVNGGAY